MLTLFHDYTSARSYLAVVRVQRLADDGVPVAFEGFEAVGVDATVPVTVEALAELAALSDAAAAEGVTLRRPAGMPPTAAAHLVGGLAEAAGLGRSWRLACYGAFWSAGADLGDHSVLLDLSVAAGLDREACAAGLAEPGGIASVRRRMAAHRREGVGGVPTILAHRTLVPGLLPEPELRTLATL